MLYVSHRLEEVFAIADRVTITRNGHDVLTKATSDLTISEVIEGMIGTQARELFPPPLPNQTTATPARLNVSGLSGQELAGISFDVTSGEVVGLAGLEGSGVSTLLGMLFGTQKAKSGEVRYPDMKGLPRNPTEAARRGICLVPADRRHQGLMLDKSILFNISNVVVGALNTGSPWFGHRSAQTRAQRQIDKLRIKRNHPIPWPISFPVETNRRSSSANGWRSHPT